jgi:hypothetical protein
MPADDRCPFAARSAESGEESERSLPDEAWTLVVHGVAGARDEFGVPLIRRLIVRGEDKAEIKAGLVRAYGSSVLAQPAEPAPLGAHDARCLEDELRRFSGR